MHHDAKTHGNWSNRCGDMGICCFFSNGGIPHIGFVVCVLGQSTKTASSFASSSSLTTSESKPIWMKSGAL